MKSKGSAAPVPRVLPYGILGPWRRDRSALGTSHLALHYMHYMRYNFGRIHKTLRVIPAMEAEKADHVWSLEEIAGLAS